MINQVKNIIFHPLFSGSAIMIFGFNAMNGLNYVYHLIMGRLLGPIGYGELAAIFSLIALLTIIPSSLNLVIVKHIAITTNAREVKEFFNFLEKKIFVFAVIISLFIVIFSPTITSFLQVGSFLSVILVAVIFIFMLPVILNRAVLQGILHFKQLVASMLLENSIKLIFGIFLVFIGMSVNGALVALVLGGASAWFITKFFLQSLTKEVTNNILKTSINTKEIFHYSLPVVVQSLALTSLYSSDLLLVKHFFSSHEAGIYASLSTLGKILFFATSPITSVMFPIISQRKSRGQSFNRIFMVSFLATVVISVIILIVYQLFPTLVVSALYGQAFLEAAPLLIWFAVFFALLAIVYLLVNFFLSLNRTGVVILPLIAALFQVLGIWFFHTNLITVIQVSIIVTLLLALTLGFYFFWIKRDEKVDC